MSQDHCFRLKKTVMLHIIKFFETGGVSNAKVMGSIPMDIDTIYSPNTL